MSDAQPDAAQVETIEADTPVTTVIRQHPLPGSVPVYEDWLKQIIPVAKSHCGHQSVNVIRPHQPDGPYTIVLHFDSVAHLRGWLDSRTRKDLVAKIRPFLRQSEEVEITSGIEFWFTPPPGGRPARPWKQYVVTLSAIFPLTVLVPLALGPVFAALPSLSVFGLRQFIVAVIIVAMMVYVIMPRYTRLVARWLFR